MAGHAALGVAVIVVLRLGAAVVVCVVCVVCVICVVRVRRACAGNAQLGCLTRGTRRRA